eukprot:g37572.t1
MDNALGPGTSHSLEAAQACGGCLDELTPVHPELNTGPASWTLPTTLLIYAYLVREEVCHIFPLFRFWTLEDPRGCYFSPVLPLYQMHLMGIS